MAVVGSHRLCGVALVRGVARKLSSRLLLTPQERADLYVSRMPIAVVTASLGGHPSERR